MTSTTESRLIQFRTPDANPTNRISSTAQTRPDRHGLWACGEDAPTEEQLAEAELDRSAGRLALATKKFEEVISRLSTQQRSAAPQLTRALAGMALTSHDASHWDAATAHYENAIDLLDQSGQTSDWKTAARLRNNLAMVYRETNRTPEAENCYTKAIALYQAAPSGNHSSDLAALYSNLAYLHYDRGAFPEALATQLKALSLSHSYLAPDDLELFTTERRAGIFAYLCDSGAEALQHLNASRKVLSLTEQTDTPAYAELLVNIAAAELLTGNTQSALQDYQKAAELIEIQRGTDDLFYAAILNNQGCLHLQLDHPTESLDCFNRCLSAYKHNPATDDASRAEVYHNLSLAWERQGNQGLADLYQRHATELLEHLTEDCRAKLIIASRSRSCVPSDSATATSVDRPTLQTFSRLPSTPGIRTKVSRLALPIKTETIDWDF